MSIMETRIVQVKNEPAVINRTNEAWSKWGWSVLSVQVTHSQNTKTYQDGWQYGSSEMTVETTTINYATITYQRDKEMRNYTQIATLQNEYETVEERIEESLKSRYEQLEKLKPPADAEYNFGCLSFIIMIVLFIFYIVPGIIYLRYKYKQRKKAESYDKAEIARMQAEYEHCKEQIQQDKIRMINEEYARIERERVMLMGE